MTFRLPLPALVLVLVPALPFAAPQPLRAAEPFLPLFSFPVAGATALPAVYDSYDLPVAPWRNDELTVETFEGQVDRRAWQLESAGASPLELLAPLRDQLLALGYEVVLDCEARRCGGFDFRFATEVLPEPGMHVDLNEFRFLSARRGGDAVGLMVSRSASAGFVQMISVGPEALPAPIPGIGGPGNSEPGMSGTGPGRSDAVAVPLSKPVTPAAPGAEANGQSQLDAGLPFALDDLVFETGSAALSDRDYASLTLVAAWLQADPARRLILVGHTDLSGALGANVALSKRRAEAVRQALITDFGIPAARMTAEGAGPLAPRASNANDEGRQKNRRVEAIPAPT
ncbi:OmpA family protein [Pseudomonas sp. GX19020]|uniref:OmpA family protein n=1 Tax=Pseudomonas sp. GX19020 TaxID=2942277 RepID=UPI002018841F|nr:OmpA family protein [Pseudomonas sp. GX19020]